ncbi:MAG: hypothetical protein HY789_12040 [Deltaproteobacteria bacterium]|nr:hypothetical protein [Deltaproteobacteria bacterium]
MTKGGKPPLRLRPGLRLKGVKEIFLSRLRIKYYPSSAEIHIIEDLLPQADIEEWRELRHLIPKSWEDYGEPFFLNLEMYDQFEVELKNLYGEG